MSANTYMIHGDRRTLRKLRRCSKWKTPIYRLSRRQLKLRRQLMRFLDGIETEEAAGVQL